MTVYRVEGQVKKRKRFSAPGTTDPKAIQKSGSFFSDVYEIVRQIPFGRVTSYGAIAAFLGIRGSARMVGWAMNASHTQLTDVPAHRVVNRNGVLTGKHHFGGPDVMKELLENEGMSITNDKIDRFKELFWDPAEHLK
jgi:methylated-DNA-protein-cysteine methyltransferase-like protein